MALYWRIYLKFDCSCCVPPLDVWRRILSKTVAQRKRYFLFSDICSIHSVV